MSTIRHSGFCLGPPIPHGRIRTRGKRTSGPARNHPLFSKHDAVSSFLSRLVLHIPPETPRDLRQQHLVRHVSQHLNRLHRRVHLFIVNLNRAPSRRARRTLPPPTPPTILLAPTAVHHRRVRQTTPGTPNAVGLIADNWIAHAGGAGGAGRSARRYPGPLGAFLSKNLGFLPSRARSDIAANRKCPRAHVDRFVPDNRAASKKSAFSSTDNRTMKLQPTSFNTLRICRT